MLLVDRRLCRTTNRHRHDHCRHNLHREQAPGCEGNALCFGWCVRARVCCLRARPPFSCVPHAAYTIYAYIFSYPPELLSMLAVAGRSHPSQPAICCPRLWALCVRACRARRGCLPHAGASPFWGPFRFYFVRDCRPSRACVGIVSLNIVIIVRRYYCKNRVSYSTVGCRNK